MPPNGGILSGPALFAKIKQSSWAKIHNYLEISSYDPLKYIMENIIVFICMRNSIRILRFRINFVMSFSSLMYQSLLFSK